MVLLSLLWKLTVDFIYSLSFSSAVAVSHYQNEVLVRSYVVWYQRLQRVTELKQLQQLIESMKMKAKLKRYLRFWKTCIFYHVPIIRTIPQLVQTHGVTGNGQNFFHFSIPTDVESQVKRLLIVMYSVVIVWY